MTGAPHDLPTAAELIEAVREWLEGDVAGVRSAPPNFHVRVATNMLAMVEREIELQPRLEAAHRARLDQLGVADDGELASGIRSGRFDDRLDEVRELVRESVIDKLRVANPAYLNPKPPDLSA